MALAVGRLAMELGVHSHDVRDVAGAIRVRVAQGMRRRARVEDPEVDRRHVPYVDDAIARHVTALADVSDAVGVDVAVLGRAEAGTHIAGVAETIAVSVRL